MLGLNWLVGLLVWLVSWAVCLGAMAGEGAALLQRLRLYIHCRTVQDCTECSEPHIFSHHGLPAGEGPSGTRF